MKPLTQGTHQNEDTTNNHNLSHDDNDPDSMEEEEAARCDWDFILSAVISSSAAVSDAIGVVEFDHDDRFLATGGIARKIRIYRAEKLVGDAERGARVSVSLDHSAACDFYIWTAARLSSLKWRPGSGSRVIGSGDYDGVVMEYDLERRLPVFERDEHGGRRVWSIDYSASDPNLGASGSDDGSFHVWDTRCDDNGGKCVASVVPNPSSRSSVCSVEFNPFGGSILAVGCADRIIYGYDVRNAAKPVFALDGHEKAVTYAKFLDSSTLVSSAVDGCLMMWNTESRELIRRYRGHVNTRRFVGLSVWGGGGLLTCGSEDNRVFVYDKRWGQPIWEGGFESLGGTTGFVSGVCWRRGGGGGGDDGCMMVAGGSDGSLQVYEGKKKRQLDSELIINDNLV